MSNIASRNCYFNPPTPCGVGPAPHIQSPPPRGFQSTHPLRGGTEITVVILNRATFQSTHPLRGGTMTACSSSRISTFQSTHPLRGGTFQLFRPGLALIISIHPPLAGWDSKSIQNSFCTLSAIDKVVRSFRYHNAFSQRRIAKTTIIATQSRCEPPRDFLFAGRPH